MNFKMKIKVLIDLCMTVLLLLLMAFQITGQQFHEWFGAGMLVLFSAHNILNYKWYKNLLQGKYSLVRALQTVINFALLISMLCLAYSGIIMSNYVFDFVSVKGATALARQMHMAASYWGFVLIGIHLGFHWGIVVGMAKNLNKQSLFKQQVCVAGNTNVSELATPDGRSMTAKAAGNREIPKAVTWVLRVIALSIAGYGAACFNRANIVSYLFLKNQFVFFDFEQSAISVFSEYLAMMGLWVFVGYYFMKLFAFRQNGNKEKK